MRKILTIALGSLALLTILLGGNEILAATAYPVRPINLIIPVEAGSDADIVTRPLVQKASAILGKPIMITNKPGGGSTIGYREVYNSKPDGYTIGMATITLVSNKVQGLMPLDYHDFSLIGTFYRMYANLYGSTKTKRPFPTIQEVITFAKANPGEVKLASAGIGMSLWVGAMAFIAGTGVDINVIPQAGSGALTMAQLAGGHVDLAVTHSAAAKSQIDAGNVRFLAVIGYDRDPAYPNVPTLKDIGYDVSWESCGIVIGPPKMPREVMEKLTKAFETAAKDSEYQKFLVERFSTPYYLPPDKITPYLDGKRKVVRDIMSKAGLLKE
jgi:tripartite-type tricarboxylate transporter receptor subunit TctC